MTESDWWSALAVLALMAFVTGLGFGFFVGGF